VTAEAVEVAQKLNLQRLVQATVDSIHAARTPYAAALAVCRLYTVLEPVRLLDDEFPEAWRDILGGRLVAYASSRRGCTRIRWHHVWMAEACLLAVMERHGMGYQAQVNDEVEAGFAHLVAELDAEKPPMRQEVADA
jgi:hypothetical protein